MSNPYMELAKDIERAQRTAPAGPQLAFSSIEDGSVDAYDGEGTFSAVLGRQWDGTYTSASVAGPKPPAPVAPTVEALAGGLTVRWNGRFAGGQTSPMDFKQVEAWVSLSADYASAKSKATIRGELGDAVVISPLAVVPHYVWLVARSQSGKQSSPSVAVAATPLSTANAEDVAQALADAQQALDVAHQAQTSVNGKNTIHRATTAPTAGAFVEGDTWEQWTTLAPGGALLASWRFDGTAWQDIILDPTYLPKLDIGQGTFGQLDGARIQASSISVDTLMVSDFTNLATINEMTGVVSDRDPGGTQIVGGWSVKKNVADKYLMFTNQRRPIPWTDGDTLRYTFTAYAPTATACTVTAWIYDQSGGYLAKTSAGVTIPAAAGTVTTTLQVPWSVSPKPFGYVLGLDGVTGVDVHVKDVEVCKMFGGDLIVDGAVTASKIDAGAIDGMVITGATIQTDAATNRGIKLDTDTLSAWDTAGNRFYHLDTNGMQIVSPSGAGLTVDIANQSSKFVGDFYSLDPGGRGMSIETRYHPAPYNFWETEVATSTGDVTEAVSSRWTTYSDGDTNAAQIVTYISSGERAGARGRGQVRLASATSTSYPSAELTSGDGGASLVLAGDGTASLWAPNGVNVKSGDWIEVGYGNAPPFENGYSNYSTDYFRFRKSALGYWELTGQLYDLASNGSAIFTLPPEARPSVDAGGRLCFWQGATPSRFVEIKIYTDGRVVAWKSGNSGGTYITAGMLVWEAA